MHAYQISVDLEVYKALTSRLQAEGQDHNAVIRELLHLDSPVEPEIEMSGFARLADFANPLSMAGSGFYSRGLLLPNGTVLRARYKGLEYTGHIRKNKWIDEQGKEHSSPSAAANAITGTTVNGWRFWEAKLPGQEGWRRLDVIQSSQ